MPDTDHSNSMGWRLENSYARLPESLHDPATPAAVPTPRLAILNDGLAKDLGLRFDGVPRDELAAMFTGQTLPPGAVPIAQAYAGHQYGGFTMLGDGRAILLGEQRTPDGRLLDVQLKGAGRTRFSRGGDGKAALAPMLREYIVSEAMHALGIPTTRSLAVTTTGEAVLRETRQPGAVLARVAASHIRVGTFEYAVRVGPPALTALADYAIARHDPALIDSPTKYLDFLTAVVGRQAALIARWQCVGFIHGVMNTDNMAVSGETIDYGPCAFMNAYDPATVYSGIDRQGRYAYGNQPRIAHWNLARLAETLLPLLDAEPEAAVAKATAVLDRYPALFEGHLLAGMRRKLGLMTEDAGDGELIESLLEWMTANRADFTNTFVDLSTGGELNANPDFQAWHRRWSARVQAQDPAATRSLMRSSNPQVIPRNVRVEEALAAAEKDDFSVLHRLLDALATPYQYRDGLEYYREPPAEETCYRTHCGT